MAIEVIDHGTWVTYKPENPPKNAPPNAVYAKRESDGVDWYVYVFPDYMRLHGNKRKLPAYHAETGALLPDIDPPVPPSNFHGGIICNIFWSEYNERYIVGTTVRDPTAVYPNDQRVIEIVGFNGTEEEAQKLWRSKVYDHVTKSFGEKPPPKEPLPSFTEQRILSTLDKITERLEKLEKHPHK